MVEITCKPKVENLEGLLRRRQGLAVPGCMWLALEKLKYMRIILIRNIWMQNGLEIRANALTRFSRAEVLINNAAAVCRALWKKPRPTKCE